MRKKGRKSLLGRKLNIAVDVVAGLQNSSCINIPELAEV